jgi:CHAT domain-containing protein/predicted negative regulator of RcsB-dependent stress response
MKLFMQAGDRKGEMESLLTLGSVFQDLGDWELAIGFLEKSVTIAEELGLGTARQNQLLASLSSSIGAYENAVRFQTKAMEDADKRYISGQRVWTTIGMGDVYSDLGDLNRAARYYSRAAAIRDTLRINAAGLNASVDMRLGNLMSAERFFASEGSISGEAVSAMRIGEVMMRNNKPDSALLFLSRSLSLFRESANWQGQVFVQLLKGELLVDKGELKTAKILLDSVILEKDYPESNWLAHYHLGRLYEKSKQNDKAIASYRESISVIEKVRSNLTIDEFKSSFFSNKRDVYNRLIYLLLEQGNQAEAFMISEQAKARAFYDILAGRRINFKPSKSADLLLLEQEKRKELQKKYLLLQKGIAVSASNPASRGIEAGQSRAALDQLQTEYEEVLQKVKLTEPAYSVMVAAQPVGINEIQSGLDPQTVIISYWISDDAISAWLVSTNDVIKTSSNIRSSDLEALVEKTRKAIKSLNKNDTREGLSRLYSLLISPFENRLAGISNIVVVPNGSLHFLPFQALIDTRGNYLVQKYNLSYAPSAGVYKICRDREIKPGMKFLGTALGDLDIDNNIGLPGTEDELKRILPLFVDKQSAIGKQSTETFLKQNAVNCNLLHIATHGSFNFRHPLYSHLLFPPSETDDGKLNVFEVFELNLNASLVTLSACETGLGNLNGGDELTGLSRAFLYAGSSSVIVSLWAVADYPTAVLMTNFYRNMKTHPVNEALTLAQRDVIKLFPEPLYWSPFILIGNGSITLN